MGKHPTTKGRKARQRKVKRYMKDREDLQVAGRIPVDKEGAVRREDVDPSSQGEQPLPGLIGRAVRRGWAVPDEKKPALVDELCGIVQDPEMDAVPKVMAYNALTKAEQLQWERDHPDEAGRSKGGVKVGVQVNNNPVSAEIAQIIQAVEAQKNVGRDVGKEIEDGQVKGQAQEEDQGGDRG